MATSQPLTPTPRRGRPSTGTAMTSAERSQKRLERIANEGGRQLSRVTLNAEAVAALVTLQARGATIDEAVSRALVALANAPEHP